VDFGRIQMICKLAKLVFTFAAQNELSRRLYLQRWPGCAFTAGPKAACQRQQ
jgi:hypothetical protein